MHKVFMNKRSLLLLGGSATVFAAAILVAVGLTFVKGQQELLVGGQGFHLGGQQFSKWTDRTPPLPTTHEGVICCLTVLVGS